MTTPGAFTASGLLPSDALRGTFIGIASELWNELGPARFLGVNRSEETVTENFLLEVQPAHPTEVATFLVAPERSFCSVCILLTEHRRAGRASIETSRSGPPLGLACDPGVSVATA
jgi:hypothetical protein